MARNSNQLADWTLGSKRRHSNDRRGSNHSYQRSISVSFSVYVDNLPYEMDEVWLRQIFRSYGDVVDVFIPNKRSSRFNTKFGFVRFSSRAEALDAVQDLHGILIRDFRIQVNLARFSQASNSSNFMHKPLAFTAGCGKQVASDYQTKFSKSRVFVDDKSPSFADIVAGKKNSVATASIKVQDEGDLWLSMSAIAKLPSQRSIESLREAFIAEGVWNVQLRPMGGTFVLLTFESIDDMNSMLEGGGLCWLMNFFDEVKQWKLEPVTEYSREVWLNCYGVPLNVWNANTFFSIGRLWGETISLDESTSSKSSFSIGKVKISTKSFEVINHVVNLEFNGQLFPIRVVEEQVGVTSFIKAICECPVDTKGQNMSRANPSVVLRAVDESDVNSFSSVDPAGDKDEDDGRDDELEGGTKILDSNILIENSTHLSCFDVLESFVGETMLPILGDQAQISNLNVVDSSNSFVEESDSPLGNILYEDKSIHVENCLEANQADGNIFEDGAAYTSSGPDDSTSADLVSTDPLINYVDYKRRKKKARTIKGYRRNPVWTKNPLKAAIFSRTSSREQIGKISKSLKLGLKKDSCDGPILSSHEDASSDYRKRISILIKDARKNMELGALCGIKFFGRESYNIKKFLESQGVEISEKEIIAFDDLEDGTSISEEF